MVALVGSLAHISIGEKVRAEGRIKRHPSFGPQVEVMNVVVSEPQSAIEIQKYLAKSVFRIGKLYAQQIVAKFGADTLKVIDAEPDRLGEIPGVGPKRLEEIKKAWHDQRNSRHTLRLC